jgi:hypothetical protein
MDLYVWLMVLVKALNSLYYDDGHQINLKMN